VTHREIPVGDWEADALCRQVDPERWFPVDSAGRVSIIEQRKVAQTECRPCPVMWQCLRAAVIREWDGCKGDRHGVWGGSTPQDRIRLEDELKKRGWAP